MSAAVSADEPMIVEESQANPLMSQRQIMLVIYALLGGMFLSALDQTIVGTAIRTIGDDLNGLDQQAWVTTAYLITSTIATPLYGKLSDLFGRRPLFVFGISVFVAGSLLSSFSTSMLMLAGFRAFQGVGAGALMSLPLAIMGDMLAPRDRAKYQGYFLATFGVASVIGPLVGGLFAGTHQILGIAGWRWVFLVNVPVGVIALLLVLAFMHLPHITHGRPRIDWWGASLVIVALVPLLLVAEQGRSWGWVSVASVSCYVIGTAGVVAFILVERAMGTDAIIPLRLFTSSGFSMTTVLSVLVGFGMFGAMMTIPLYLQIVMGFTPTRSGLATLPMMFGVMLSSIGTGQIVARTGKYGVFPKTGTLTVTVGFVLLVFLTVDSSYWYLSLAMFVIGLGLGQMMQTLTMAAQAATEAQDIGIATSASTFFRQIGGTLGTAVLLSLLFTVLPTQLASSMGNQADLTNALDAALDPAVASAPQNKAVMAKIWTPIVDKVHTQVQQNLDQATAQVDAKVEAGLRQKVSDAAHAQAAEGAGKLADGAQALDAGLAKLSDGTTAYVDGVGQIGTGAGQLATAAGQAASASTQLSTGASQLASGLSSVSGAATTAAAQAQQATTQFAGLQAALTALSTDQTQCQAGQTADCSKLTADQSALQQQMKQLGTSVATTSAYLNGGSGQQGIAAGLSGLASGAQTVAQGTSSLSSGLQQLSAGASQLSSGASTAATKGGALAQGVQASASGTQKLSDGASKLSGVDAMIDQKVAQLLPDAQKAALEKVAEQRHLSIVDGKLSVDYTNAVQRQAIVDEVAPKMAASIAGVKATGSGDTSDTSFLVGADSRLTRPFLKGFNASVIRVYWVGLAVMLVTFALTLFFKAPPLRTRSALEERAELQGAQVHGAGPGGDDNTDPSSDGDASTGTVPGRGTNEE